MTDAVLHTGRLHLRLLDAGEPSHAGLYRAIYTCPQVMASITPPLTPEAADLAFARACRHNDRSAPGHRFWAVADREGGKQLALAALQRQGGRAEFGVMVRPEAWQRRVANETLGALLAYAFGPMGLDAVDVRRADDGYAPIVHRLVAPYGFERVPALSVGCHWTLSSHQWHAGNT
jgi:RimJ/RimL family protein N-acetyltransferase